MKVFYEGGAFFLSAWGGIHRYHTCLINHLPTEVQSTLMVPKRSGHQITHPNCRVLNVRTSAPIKQLRGPWLELRARHLSWQANRIARDVEHWTYYSGLCSRRIQTARSPIVVTVHDFIHEMYPTDDPDESHRRCKRDAIGVADAIICVSKFTHQQLIELHPGAAHKSRVIWHGNALRGVRPAPLPDCLRNRRFALYVGRRSGYKNFRTLYQAWSRVREKSDLALVVVGPDWSPEERNEFVRQQSTDNLFLIVSAPDALMCSLYQQCVCFVFPTRMEGFGLPALEAMECGCPLLLSDTEALREVAGDTAHYFDPDDRSTLSEMLRAAAQEALPDQARRTSGGVARASQFSWKRTADETMDVYGELVGISRHGLKRAG